MKIKRMATLPKQQVSHNSAIEKMAWLTMGEVGPITQFAQANFPPGEVAAGHVHHDMTEVFLISAGTATMQLSQRAEQLQTGDCIVIEPGEWHELQNNSSEVLQVVYFGVKSLPSRA